MIIRIATGTLALLLATIMLREPNRLRSGLYFSFVAVGLCAFLIGNTIAEPFEKNGIAGLLRDVLSGHLAIFIWWFCLSVFDDDFRISWFEAGVSLAWLSFFLARYVDTSPAFLNWGQIALGMFIVSHIGWRLISEKPMDLIERRRKYRYAVAALPAGLLMFDLVIDLVLGASWKPLGFTLVQDLTILAFILGLCFWALDISVERMTFAAPDEVSDISTKPRILPADQQIYALLSRLMEEEQLFLSPDIKVSDVANQLAISEARLRRVINQAFGYGNFRQFLNAFRLEFACNRLADPAHASEKILSISMDSGFASLASFNRVFKDVHGCTPTEYRRQALAQMGNGAFPV